ncbi:MAG: hypothetical protein MJY85_00755 [Fibrobacter sp.]|nr:hypothetical protein [Fibrobacter sp.]
MKFENMTAAHEAAYIYLAQKGVKGAARKLFMIYIEPIMTQHKFSAIGSAPRKLGYNWSRNFVNFVSHSGEIYLNYYKAVMDYDFHARSKTAKLPFLAYLRTIIDFRALDELDSEKEYKNKFVTFSELKNKSAQKGIDMDDEDIVEQQAYRDLMYNPELSDRKQQELEELVANLVSKNANDEKTSTFIKGYLEVCNEPDGDKNTMRKVGEYMQAADIRNHGKYTAPKAKKDPRTDAYYWASKCMVHLDEEDRENFNEVMRHYAE